MEIIVKDSQSNPNRAAEVAGELILQDGIDLMVVGATPENSNPVCDQCELNGVPCVSTTTPWQPWFNWVVAAVFIVVIGGIGTLEGPILGTAIFFALRWLLADYGTWYWLVMGAVAVGVVVFAPAGIWGYVRTRWDLQLLPLQRRIILAEPPPRRGAAPLTLAGKAETGRT